MKIKSTLPHKYKKDTPFIFPVSIHLENLLYLFQGHGDAELTQQLLG